MNGNYFLLYFYYGQKLQVNWLLFTGGGRSPDASHTRRARRAEFRAAARKNSNSFFPETAFRSARPAGVAKNTSRGANVLCAKAQSALSAALPLLVQSLCD